MRPHFRYRPLAWLLVPGLALAIAVWGHWVRADRLGKVSSLAGWSVDAPRPDPSSPTGWEGNRHQLILTPPLEQGQRWIGQTERMLAAGTLRVRQVDSDNAPLGRPALSASLYSWWLAGLAWCDSILNDIPLGQAVERTAFHANPLLQVLFIVAALPFAVRRFGHAAGMLLALGAATMYPIVGSFAPGLPGPRGLAIICLFWSLLPLASAALGVADPHAAEGASHRPRLPFVLAALAGALGLWVDPWLQLSGLVGMALGALLAARVARGQSAGAGFFAPANWRTWARSIGLCALFLYLLDYYPHGTAFQPAALHPLHAVGAWGLGEVLALALPWIATGQRPTGWFDRTRLALAILAVAAFPVTLRFSNALSRSATDLGLSRLSDLPEGISAANLGAWLSGPGQGGRFLACVLPLCAVVIGLAVAWHRVPTRRAALAMVLGPMVIFATLSCFHLSQFGALDCMLLVAIPVLVAAPRVALMGPRHWLAAAACLLLLVPGVCQFVPKTLFRPIAEVTELELQGILERDLAHWLAARTAGEETNLLAPPDLVSALSYYGGLHALDSLAWENDDGLTAAVRIARAGTLDEARALVENRGVTHIVLPSWNRLLDILAGTESTNGARDLLQADKFLPQLRQWNLPPWLQPLSYHIPDSAHFPGESVMVLVVGDELENATALAQLAEYYVENAMPEDAARMREPLGQFPGDLGVLAALAQVQSTIGDKAGLAASHEAIDVLLSAGSAEGLPWDRRFSLAIVLVLARKADVARPLFTDCLAELDEGKLRRMSPSALMRLHALAKLFDLEIPDPHLRSLAPSLLPPPLRARLPSR